MLTRCQKGMWDGKATMKRVILYYVGGKRKCLDSG